MPGTTTSLAEQSQTGNKSIVDNFEPRRYKQPDMRAEEDAEMYWVRKMEDCGVCRRVGTVISAGIVVGTAWHGLAALVRLF